MTPNQLQQYLDKLDVTLSGVDNGVVSNTFFASYADMAELQSAQHRTILLRTLMCLLVTVLALKLK